MERDWDAELKLRKQQHKFHVIAIKHLEEKIRCTVDHCKVEIITHTSAPNKKQQHRDSSEWQTPQKKPPNWFRCSEQKMILHTDTPRDRTSINTTCDNNKELRKGHLSGNTIVNHTPICLQCFMQVSESQGVSGENENWPFLCWKKGNFSLWN